MVGSRSPGDFVLGDETLYLSSWSCRGLIVRPLVDGAISARWIDRDDGVAPDFESIARGADGLGHCARGDGEGYVDQVGELHRAEADITSVPVEVARRAIHFTGD